MIRYIGGHSLIPEDHAFPVLGFLEFAQPSLGRAREATRRSTLPRSRRGRGKLFQLLSKAPCSFMVYIEPKVIIWFIW